MTTARRVANGAEVPAVRRRGLRAVAPADDVANTKRLGQLEEFKLVLRASTNKRGKPFDEKTIGAYRDAVLAWNRWLTANSFDGGFEDVTVMHYNAFMADYLKTHSLGGTVTKQGNLRSFLGYIADEYEVPNVWDHAKRNKYSRQDDHPEVLAEKVIDDLLRVTSGKGFEDRRDHAIIRLLLHGPRRAEVAGLDVDSLDLVSAVRSVLLPGVKGSAGRRIGLGDKDVLAFQRYLRMREQHKRINRSRDRYAQDGNPLWIGVKTGARLTGGGIYQILRRRAVQAGYDKSVIYTHLFRHTAAHEFMDAGGTDTNAMAHFGWRDRSMLDRYGASAAERRAIKAVVSSGFADRH